MMEEMGMEAFRDTVVEYTRRLRPGFEPPRAMPAPAEPYARRDITGVHPQKQEGKSWVCVSLSPVGRLTPELVRRISAAGAGGGIDGRSSTGFQDFVVGKSWLDAGRAAQKCGRSGGNRRPLLWSMKIYITVQCTGACWGILWSREGERRVGREGELDHEAARSGQRNGTRTDTWGDRASLSRLSGRRGGGGRGKVGGESIGA